MKSSPPRSKEAAECSPSTLMPEAEPPTAFFATSSSELAEAAAEAAVDVGTIFYFLLMVLDPPAPFLFFDSATAVAFLAAAFFAFSSIDLSTFEGTLCSS